MSEQRIYFISGPTDITGEEFTSNIARKIKKVNSQYDCKFLVDESACGKLSQQYLRKIGICPTKITIYHRTDIAPENKHNYRTKSFSTNIQKCVEATRMSTHDIAWFRPEDPDSEPARNKLRRLENKQINTNKYK